MRAKQFSGPGASTPEWAELGRMQRSRKALKVRMVRMAARASPSLTRRMGTPFVAR